MNLKGFIMEDDQGREFVMVCQRPSTKSGKVFLLRGWQRRRLIPLHHSEREARQIVEGVLITLDDLFKTFPRSVRDADKTCSDRTSSSARLLKSSRAVLLRKNTIEEGSW
jgi:hypothetical protein